MSNNHQWNTFRPANKGPNYNVLRQDQVNGPFKRWGQRTSGICKNHDILFRIHTNQYAAKRKCDQTPGCVAVSVQRGSNGQYWRNGIRWQAGRLLKYRGKAALAYIVQDAHFYGCRSKSYHRNNDWAHFVKP